jgi:nucleoside-diphosphate-sugar epimerase
MSILVTGATGFLGSHVAEALSKAGREVVALVRSSSNTKFLETLPGVRLVRGAIEDAASLRPALEGVTGVIHSAGLTKAKSPTEFMRVNTEGTENLLEAAIESGRVTRFVFVSSAAVGGPSGADGQPVRVGSETAPVTAYGRSKLAAERSVLAVKDKLRSVILRPAVIYGPRDAEILVFFKAVQNGVLPLTNPLGALTSMIYASDCADACVRALDADVPSGSTYFLEDGHPVSFGEMISQIEIALGKKAWLRVPLPSKVTQAAAAATEVFGKLTNRAVMFTRDKCNELQATGWVSDGTSARSELAWTPAVTFPEGLQRTVLAYRDAGWL